MPASSDPTILHLAAEVGLADEGSDTNLGTARQGSRQLGDRCEPISTSGRELLLFVHSISAAVQGPSAQRSEGQATEPALCRSGARGLVISLPEGRLRRTRHVLALSASVPISSIGRDGFLS